jgi:hypothetical protein
MTANYSKTNEWIKMFYFSIPKTNIATHDRVNITESQKPAKSVPSIGVITTEAISRPTIASVRINCANPSKMGITIEKLERHWTSLSKSLEYKYAGCILLIEMTNKIWLLV